MGRTLLDDERAAPPAARSPRRRHSPQTDLRRPRSPGRLRRRLRRLLWLPRLPGAGAAFVASSMFVSAVLLRAWPRPALWLDEAQSVSFARLPLTELPGALREDGAPPVYYVVLHGWIRVFGDGDAAVRSLSVLCSLAALLVLSVAARRWFGTRAAQAAFVLMAVSPFAVRYGSEARMYSLVMLEVSAGLVVVQRLWARPGRCPWAALVVLSAALLYTHYWAVYLVGAFGAVLVAVAVLAVRDGGGERVRRSLRVLLAVGAGVVLWLPWVPSFVFQSRRTGTPWASPVSVGTLFDAIGFRFSTHDWAVPALPALVAAGALVAVWSRPSTATVRHRRAVAVAAVLVLSVALAFAGAATSDSAFTSRYASVMFPLAVLLAGAGVARVRSEAMRATVLLAVVALAVPLSVREIRSARTTAEAVAPMVVASAAPGDVVVYCPDQLGPAFSRLLDRADAGLAERSFPPGSTPQRVDWVDYARRYSSASPDQFVADLDAGFPAATVWLVVSVTYPPTEPACGDLLAALRADRPGTLLRADDPSVADHGALWRFAPSP